MTSEPAGRKQPGRDTGAGADEMSPAMNRMEIVRVEDLVVRFRDAVALDGVNLSIYSGAFTGLIGPNGAGKTTLLRVLLGLIKPDRGSVLVFGHPPGHAHNLIGYVPQYTRFDPAFPVSARDVALMGRHSVAGVGRPFRAEDYEAADEALERVGISDLAGKRFGSLSGGQRQKTLIARALSGRPRLLLMDEPTTGVDMLSQESFYSLLQDLKRDLNMTIVLVSHDIGVIKSQVDQIVCVNKKIYCHGPPMEVLRSGGIGSAYVKGSEIVTHEHGAPRPSPGERAGGGRE